MPEALGTGTEQDDPVSLSEATETQEPGGPHVPEPPSSVASPLPPPVSSDPRCSTSWPALPPVAPASRPLNSSGTLDQSAQRSIMCRQHITRPLLDVRRDIGINSSGTLDQSAQRSIMCRQHITRPLLDVRRDIGINKATFKASPPDGRVVASPPSRHPIHWKVLWHQKPVGTVPNWSFLKIVALRLS